MENDLKSRLPYLPLEILGRVELWLVYKDLKKAGTITSRDRKNSKSRVEKWLKDASIFFQVDSKYSDLFHVSKNKDVATQLNKIMWSEKQTNVYKKGILYGYPKKAVKTFSISPAKCTVLSGKYKNKPWFPYARYMFRKENVKDDSKSARLWSETLKKDIPLLDKWYTNVIMKTNL